MIDELTESDNQKAAGPLAEADQRIRLEMEVAQKVRRHEMLCQTLTSRPNSAASTQSNRTTASAVVETNARNSRELTNAEITRIHISEPIDDEPSNTESYLAESSKTSIDQISITPPNQQENSQPVFRSRLHEQNVNLKIVIQKPTSQQTAIISTTFNQHATLQRSLESGLHCFSGNTMNIQNLPTCISSFVHGPDTVQTTMLHPKTIQLLVRQDLTITLHHGQCHHYVINGLQHPPPLQSAINMFKRLLTTDYQVLCLSKTTRSLQINYHLH